MTREELELIGELSPDDIEEMDYISLYEIIQKLCSESLYMMTRIENQDSLLSQYNHILRKLNKENKKLCKIIEK